MLAPALLAALLAANPPAGAPCTTGPDAPVREAYRLERRSLAATAPRTAQPPWRSPHRERLMSARLVALLRADERSSAETGDVGYLDGDPFLDAQDWRDDVLSDLAIDVVSRSADRAEVRARFTNGGPVDLRFDVVREGGRWVIDDIRAGGRSLRDGLAGEPAAAPAGSPLRSLPPDPASAASR